MTFSPTNISLSGLQFTCPRPYNRPALTATSVIALPGLGYDPFTSWQYSCSGDSFMWLRYSLPDLVPGAQVSLYGYDTGPDTSQGPVSIQSTAISLISGLRGMGRSGSSAKPVVFLAHSLGGTVLKQGLIEMANAGPSELFMLQTVKACIVMAVLNRLPQPSELAAIASRGDLAGLLKGLQAASNFGYLSSMSGMAGGIAQADGIRLCSGYETVETAISPPKVSSATLHFVSCISPADSGVLRQQGGGLGTRDRACYFASIARRRIHPRWLRDVGPVSHCKAASRSTSSRAWKSSDTDHRYVHSGDYGAIQAKIGSNRTCYGDERDEILETP